MHPQRFTVTLAPDSRGRVFVPVPFDPDEVWRAKPRHHVSGTINGMSIRAVIESEGDQRGFTLGPAWLRGCTVAAGDTVTVEIAPEGPQRDDLADDVAAALDANPRAGPSSTRWRSSIAGHTCAGSTPPSAPRSCGRNESPR